MSEYSLLIILSNGLKSSDKVLRSLSRAEEQ